MKTSNNKTIPFDTAKSIKKAQELQGKENSSQLTSDGQEYNWQGSMERLHLVREGIPYQSIEVISHRLNKPVKSILNLVGMPQTTYNKKKSERSLLDSRDSELVLLISELIDFGNEVFNGETEKFKRWIKKPNLSLGGNTPESLLDTTTGILEVRNSLNRLEYGNFA